MKTEPPHTTGVEFPASGSAVRHFTFSVFDHFTGAAGAAAIPSPFAPRHPGQFSAHTGVTAAITKIHSRRIISSAYQTGQLIGVHRRPNRFSRQRESEQS